MNLLVTGSSGFVGRRVVETARSKGFSVVEHRRSVSRDSRVVSCDINASTDWGDCFSGVDCVVHCAAAVHQMNLSGEDSHLFYQAVNTYGTLNLAQQAAKAGVKRFVFISSVKVNGEWSDDHPFQPASSHIPDDDYGKSKFDAEKGLRQLADQSGLEVVIIRPPLVYGEGVKANFLSLLRVCEKGLPLPFGSIHNRRSFVYLDNLVDFILTCCSHVNAVNKTFLVSDDYDVSTTQLMKTISAYLGVPSRLIPIPALVLRLLLGCLGKKDIAYRLLNNLQVDMAAAKDELDWHPPYKFQQGIERTVKYYIQNKGR